jgi:uncharacterized protein (UPF0332 family)
MTDEEARREVVRYWLDQAREALASVRSESAAGRFNFAVNRAYYACFYAASAVLLSEGRKFVKHSGVRAALHRHLVKTGRIEPDLGRCYDLLYQRRGQADYAELVTFDQPQVAEMTRKAGEFVSAMERILAQAT